MNSEPLSESSPSKGNGRVRSMSTSAWKHQRCALFGNARISVQPVATQVRSRVWQNCPTGLPPSWATRSTSQNPGARVVPVGEGADRDLTLQQGAWLGAGTALDLEPLALGCEEPVDRRSRDVQELL